MMMIQDLITILPAIIVAVWGIVLLVVDLWIPAKNKGLTAVLAAVGLAVATGVSFSLFPLRQTGFNNMAVLDGFAIFADIVILVSGMLAIGLSYDFLRKIDIHRSEYYILLLISIAGMILMVHAYDLIVVFLALELLSIPLYVLSGFARPQRESEESALKYFLLGTFSSGFFLYGVALIYGGTATTNLPKIVAAVSAGDAVNFPLFLVGAALLLVGLAFKVSAVPFHMWTPDVYQGAPSSVTAFMSVSVKVAGFATLLRVFVQVFPVLAESLAPVLWALAALTMIFGNLLAIVQNNIKRLLAYSSIAHGGYLLMAFVAYGNGEVVGNAVAATLFYLVGYGLTSFAAWGVVLAAEKLEGRGLELSEYAGLGRKYPLLGAAMIAAMFSFIGIPPTLGFWGKFYIFSAAIQAGSIGLALVGLLTSILSAYYYLRVLVVMYMQPGEPVATPTTWINVVTLASAAAVVLLALFPGSLIALAQQAMMWLAS
jgi:NADH-quinone oxidoreductase subunit N